MKKKIILSVILIALLIIGSVLIYEKNNRVSIIENIKNTINKQSQITENENVTTVDVTNLSSGEVIEHEHVFKSMYDENMHWNECIICGQKSSIVNHSFTTTWSLGYESCKYPNTSTSTCTCGYSKVGVKPCVWDGKTYMKGGWINHNLKCSVCNAAIWNLYYMNSYGKGELYDAHHTLTYEENKHEWCYKSDGTRITCSNAGTCAICKNTYTSNNHVLITVDEKIYCEICNKEFGTCTEKITRDSNIPTTYTLVYDIVLTNGATFNATGGVRNFNAFSATNQSLTSGSVGSTNIKLVSTAKFVSNYKSTYDVYSNYSVKINGVICGAKTKWNMLYSDVQKPIISEIDIGNNNIWYKNRKITISGTENWTNTVNIKIIDDKENIVYSGNTKVNNGNYSASCTPDIEAHENGRIFKVFVIDECENATEQEFNISKIDNIAPEITSRNKVGNEWSKQKQFTFSSTDKGIGNVSIAFNDIKDLSLASFNGEEYFRNYEFIGDVYIPKELSVLYKDELGNTSMQMITIDKIDNTAPTITNARIHNNKLIVEANDIKEGLGEGSGVSKYRYITSTEKLTNPEITDTAIEVNSNENIVVGNISEVKYIYVAAEDLVGNISEVYEVEVPQLVLTSKVNLSVANGKGGIELDWSEYDLEDKYFVIYKKEENASEWEKIVSLEDKLTGGKYTDISANDKTNSSVPTINIEGKQENNNIEITQDSTDTGTKYTYYIEAYDSNTNILLSKSNS